MSLADNPQGPANAVLLWDRVKRERNGHEPLHAATVVSMVLILLGVTARFLVPMQPVDSV